MAVTDGQKVNAEVTNAAYLSKTQGGDTTGIIGLKNDSIIVSGPEIDNVQRQLNFARKAVTQPTIATDGQITSVNLVGTQVFTIESSGGAVTMSTTEPIISDSPSAGQELVIMGSSSTNTVTLENVDAADGVLLNGQITFVAGTVLRLIYNAVIDRWVEVSRNGI